MKPNSSKTSSKTYQSILKTFYNGQKIPIIPPILTDGKLKFDIKIRANYCNNFFASQCNPLVNNSKLPDKTTLQLDLLQLSSTTIIFLKIIRSLNINKAHGHDGISVRMIKCVMNHWFSQCHLFSGVVLILAFTQILGRNLTQFQCIREVINKL